MSIPPSSPLPSSNHSEGIDIVQYNVTEKNDNNKYIFHTKQIKVVHKCSSHPSKPTTNNQQLINKIQNHDKKTTPCTLPIRRDNYSSCSCTCTLVAITKTGTSSSSSCSWWPWWWWLAFDVSDDSRTLHRLLARFALAVSDTTVYCSTNALQSVCERERAFVCVCVWVWVFVMRVRESKRPHFPFRCFTHFCVQMLCETIIKL